MIAREIIDHCYMDINNQVDLLFKLVNSYRLMVGSADELNKIALAKKKDIKKSLDRVNCVGEIIDELICNIQNTKCVYLDYTTLKAESFDQILGAYVATEVIEISSKLDLKD